MTAWRASWLEPDRLPVQLLLCRADVLSVFLCLLRLLWHSVDGRGCSSLPICLFRSDARCSSSWPCVAGRSAITASGDSAGFDVDGEHDVAWVRARAQVAAIRSGNVQMFFPECNLLIRAGERDPSGVPDYNAVVEVLPAS
jgi:hypothetical protein